MKNQGSFKYVILVALNVIAGIVLFSHINHQRYKIQNLNHYIKHSTWNDFYPSDSIYNQPQIPNGIDYEVQWQLEHPATGRDTIYKACYYQLELDYQICVEDYNMKKAINKGYTIYLHFKKSKYENERINQYVDYYIHRSKLPSFYSASRNAFTKSQPSSSD